MPCDTCGHTLESVGHLNALWRVFHCPRCGTMVIKKRSSMIEGQGETRREVTTPKLVRHATAVLSEACATGYADVRSLLRPLRNMAEAVNCPPPPES